MHTVRLRQPVSSAMLGTFGEKKETNCSITKTIKIAWKRAKIRQKSDELKNMDRGEKT